MNSYSLCPLGRGTVQGVENREAVGVLLAQAVEFAAQEDVLLRHVGENQRNFRPVLGIVEDGVQNLQVGR